MNAGYNVSETFLECSFTGYTTQKFDCKDVVKTVLDLNYFVCYSMDLPQDAQQVLARKGLRLLINSQLSLYPRNAKNEMQLSGYAGLFVSVNDKYDPTNWYKSVITPGTYAKVSLSATHAILMNTDRGAEPQSCVEDGSDMYTVFNASYSRTACQMDCFWGAVVRHCNCVMQIDKEFVKSDVLAQAPICSFYQKTSCIMPNVSGSQVVQQEMKECRQRCDTPCDSMRFDMRVSSAALNPAKFAHLNVSVKELVQLDIALSRLEISEIFQSADKTVAQAVADIGGQVNLWLGASIITMLEIPIFIVAICMYRAYQGTVDLVWGKKTFE